MDRNTFTGLFLIMIVLAGSFYFFGPSQTEINKEKERIAADSLKKVAAATKTTAPATAAAKPAVDSATLSGLWQRIRQERYCNFLCRRCIPLHL
jgi:YidC/Oxa1 family membrane protein insertase